MRKGSAFIAVAAMLMMAQVTGLGDWKSQLAKKAVGQAVQQAIQDAIEDAAKDAAFDAALGAALDRIPPAEDLRNAIQLTEVGSAASEGIELAMTVSDVASTMDKALDAADAARKAHNVLKTIKKIR